MIAIMRETSRPLAVALLLAATGAVAFPQRTAFTNTTTTPATQTTLPSGSETTPGPSLTRSCGFWLPNEIFLNSWWTEHATFTVATEMDYYIQYNNTLVLANSTSKYNGFTASFTVTEGENSGKVNSIVYTDFDRLATMGVLASMQWEFPGVPTDLISLLPSTTEEFTYAETRLHTYSEITTEWGISSTRTKTVVASPTPYAEPILGILDVKYLDGSGNVVEATNYTDLGTLGYTGGIWSNSTVDWPSKVYFDSIPPEFIEWVQRNASISSQFPWLSECTNFVSKRPTGAPTVHVVVSTLTHKTSSIIATRPENFGGAIPVRSSKTTTESSVRKTSDVSPETTSSSATRPQTTATTSGGTVATTVTQTSAGDTQRPTTASTGQGSIGTNTQQASPISEQTSSDTEQLPPTTSQHLSTGSEQVPTSVVEQPTSVAQISSTDVVPTTGPAQPTPVTVSQATNSQAPGTVGLSSGIGGGLSSATTVVAGSGPSSALSLSGVPIGLPTGVSTGSDSGPVPTTQIGSLAGDTGLPSVALPVNTWTNGVSVPSSNTDVVAAPHGSTTMIAAGSNSNTRVSSPTVPTNGQMASSGAYTGGQEANTQTISPSNAGTPVAIAPILTLDSTTVTPNPSSEYIIGTQTLLPGGPAITIGETAYSITASTTAVVNSLASSDAEVPQITLGSSVIAPNPSSGFMYASQTLSAGGSGIVVDGTTYSLAISGSETAIVENGITSTLIMSPAPPGEVTQSVPVVNVVASAVVSDNNSGVVGSLTTITGSLIPGQILSTGNSVAVEAQNPTASPSTPIAEDGDVPTASPVVKISVPALITASPSPLFSVIVNTVAPVITIGSSVMTQNFAFEYLIGDQTLTPGGSGIIVQRTTYSLAISASAILVNGISTPIPASQATEIVVAGHTLKPGESAIQVHGTTYSLVSSGNAVVINGQTSSLSASTTTITTTTTPASVTRTVSVGPGGEYVVGGKTYTLHTSGAPRSSGSASPFASTDSVVVVDGQTSTLSATTSTQGTEVIVWTGLLTPTTTSGSTQSSGNRIPNSGSSTTTTLTPPTDSSPSTAATTSTAGVQRSMQRSLWEVLSAVVIAMMIH